MIELFFFFIIGFFSGRKGWPFLLSLFLSLGTWLFWTLYAVGTSDILWAIIQAFSSAITFWLILPATGLGFWVGRQTQPSE